MDVVASPSPRAGAVAVWRLPELGALSRKDLSDLATGLQDADASAAVGAVLLTGSSAHFCSGLDLLEFEDGDRLDDLAASLRRCFLAFARLTKPLVIAVDGLACGFGATMLCHADVVIISDRTRLRMPFLDLGLLPEAGSTILLAEKIGHVSAYRLLCLGEEIDATEALRMGLVTGIVPPAIVEPHAMRLAQRLVRRAPDLAASASALMRRGRDDVLKRIDLEVAMCLDRMRDPQVRRRIVRMAGASQKIQARA